MTGWPAHRYEKRNWTPLGRYHNVPDRAPTRIEVSIPPMIAGLPYDPAGPVAREHESAMIALVRLDAVFGRNLAPLAEFLLRSESLTTPAVSAGWRSFGDALVGGNAGEQGHAQLAAVHALVFLVRVGATGPVTLAALRKAHRLLMEADPRALNSGGLRTSQNWVGVAGSSALDAEHVMPPPELLPGLLDDLLVFVNRSDLPILAQAAIVHAQLLSIHPFADGNGRLARALVGVILHRRGLTRRVTVPLVAAMKADTDNYVAQLDNYRRGDVDAMVGFLSRAVLQACETAEQSATRLAGLPQRWRDIARPAADSVADALIARLLDMPIFNAETARQIAAADAVATARALDRLTEAGILEMLPAAEAGRVWAARDVFAELDALPLVTGVDCPPVSSWQLDSVMLLSSCRFRL